MAISIIGFPDSGKSHWGRVWAQQLGVTLVDSDEAICHLHGHHNPRSMLQSLGRQRFEDIQRDWLSQLPPFHGFLICGGGLPLIEAIESLLAHHGPIVYLRRSWAKIQRHLDPNFSEQPVDISWYQNRDDRYRAIANHVIEWHNQTYDMTTTWTRLLHHPEYIE